MHPAPPEASQTATSVDQTQQSLSPPTQHGLSDNEPRASGGTLSSDNPREPSHLLEDLDYLSVSSGGTQRGRSANAGRISSRDNSSQEGSPGSRIDEYERAHVQHRKRSDGIIFQIVPSATDKSRRVFIESFPNGTTNILCSEVLLTGLQRSSPISCPTCLRKLSPP